MYSTKWWTPWGRFTRICANWPCLKPILLWGQAYQNHILNSTFNPDLTLNHNRVKAYLHKEQLAWKTCTRLIVYPFMCFGHFLDRKKDRNIVRKKDCVREMSDLYLHEHHFSMMFLVLSHNKIQTWNPNLLRECHKFNVNSCGANKNILSWSLSRKALNLIYLFIYFNMKTQTPALRKILTSKASVSQEQTVLMYAFLWNTFHFPITGRNTKVNRLFDFCNAVRQSSLSMTKQNSQQWINKKNISHNPSHKSERTEQCEDDGHNTMKKCENNNSHPKNRKRHKQGYDSNRIIVTN